MRETQIQPLIWEDPKCQGATKPVHHNSRARAPDPQLLKPVGSGICALQQEKSLQLESSPHLLQLQKSPRSNQDSAQP